MVELLAPAGSPSSVEAAVQGGADAIYLGYGDFNARRNAKNFTLEQLEESIDYCHIRGVSVFLTLNTLLNQREIVQAQSLVADVAAIGMDAVIVQDMGVAQLVKAVAPTMEVHASTQMSVHSLDGILALADMGFSRVVLARELGKSEIAYLAQHSPLPLEVFVHGAQCMSYSGQCFLSAMVGQRSGNRGLCAQPCRLDYGWKGESGSSRPVMSLKDMSLIHQVCELSDMGIASFKLEGRMKRPEYVYLVTKIYHDVLWERREPRPEEMKALEQAFSRQGFTQGYYQEEIGPAMFGFRQQEPEPKELFQQARQNYENKELRKVEIQCDITLDEHLDLRFRDDLGHLVHRTVDGVQEAKNKALTEESIMAQLQRTGGTPYEMVAGELHVATGKAMALSGLNQIRREMLEEMSKLRKEDGKRSVESGTVCGFSPLEKGKNPSSPPVYTLWLRNPSQLSCQLLDLSPSLCYVPLSLPEDRVKDCLQRGIALCVQVPSIATQKEKEEKLRPMLAQWREWGVTQALVGTLDSARFAFGLGFSLRGDYGLGVMNHQSIAQWNEALEFLSMTLSFELKFPQMRDLSKDLPLEFLLYGHLPLMTTKNCMIGNHMANKTGNKGKPSQSCGKKCKSNMSLVDRKGEEFPVESSFGGRNTVFNGRPLYLADKKADWASLGLWAGRLCFTRESPEDCVAVLKAHQQGTGQAPEIFTRGLYYRGVN